MNPQVLFGDSYKIKINNHEYKGFRIPTAITLNGRIIVFVETNICDQEGYETSNRHILSVYSDDLGQSWSDPINIAENEGLSGWETRNYHDPSPVEVGGDKCILFYTWNDGQYSFNHMMENQENHKNKINRCEYEWDSSTFEFVDHMEIRGQIALPEWTYFTTTPCNSISNNKNRIFVPCYYSKLVGETYQESYAYVIYSDDVGFNFKMSDLAENYTNETTISVIGDKIVHNMRHEDKYGRVVRVSNDNGETYNEEVYYPSEKISKCQGSMINYQGRKEKLLFSCPARDSGHFLDRFDLCLYEIAADQNYEHRKLFRIFRGSVGYSNLLECSGRLFIVYEQDDYNKIVFQELELELEKKALQEVQWTYSDLVDPDSSVISLDEEDSKFLEHLYQTRTTLAYSYVNNLLELNNMKFNIDFDRMLLNKVNEFGFPIRNINDAVQYQLKRELKSS